MKHLFKALADFQQEVPVIHKGTKGYGYSYADLPTIFDVINPLLKNNGLGFTQLIEGTSIKTILFHVESGETIESITAIPQNVSLKGMNEFQVLGSAITYIRRYALSSALGLVTDKDTDAGGQQVKKEETKQVDPASLFPELKRLFQEKANKIDADHFPAIEKTVNEKIVSNYSKVLTHLKSL